MMVNGCAIDLFFGFDRIKFFVDARRRYASWLLASLRYPPDIGA